MITAIQEATDAEKAELTPFHMAVYDWHRHKSKGQNLIPPFWLVMSAEAKEEARQDFLAWLDDKAPEIFGKHTIESATRFVDSMTRDNAILRQQMGQWIEMEIGARKAREDGNPRAFFAG